MSVDEATAERIRTALAPVAGRVREQRMFGGIGWMVEGNMAVGTWDGSGLLVRVGKDGMEAALAEEHVGRMQMGERTMNGFVVIDPAGIATDATLQAWVDRGVAVALALPPK